MERTHRIFPLAAAVLLAVALLCSCSDFAANTSGKMHVLSIGLSYKDTGASELGGPINDATEFCAAMDGMLNSKSIPRKIQCMLQEGDADDPSDRMYPTDTNVQAAVKGLGAASNDMVLLYFSGHGQDAWWAECPVCGTEVRVLADGGAMPENVHCECCSDAIIVLGNLAYLESVSGSDLSAAASQWLGKTIGNDEFAAALRASGSASAKEMLTLLPWFGMDEAPLLSFSLRGFFVTAPDSPVPFATWGGTVAPEGTLFAAVIGKMEADAVLPDVGNYRNNITGYYAALNARFAYYGLGAAHVQAFDRYWNIYAREVWPRQNWTEFYMDEFVDLLETLPCRSVLIADCCYSGFAEKDRDYEPVSLGSAFSSMFSRRTGGKVTVMAASTTAQTSLDSYASTEDGGVEKHGLFTISLLGELGWRFSLTRKTYATINGSPRQVNGYPGSVPERKTVRQVMDSIRAGWSYMNQTPVVNVTYLDTVLIP